MAFSYLQACERLLRELQSRQYTLVTQALKPTDPPPFSSKFVQLSWLERTPFYDVLAYAFNESIKWLQELQDRTYDPDWYLVRVDPAVSPLIVDDWFLVATSKVEALAMVIECMVNDYVTPVRAFQEDDSTTILGETGVIVTIERMRFISVGEKQSLRAKNALKRVRRWDDGPELKKALARIQGLSNFIVGSSPLPGRPSGDCLYPSASSLCSLLEDALAILVVEPVPRNVVQELLAHFLGFESWQHFHALVDAREAAVERPYGVFREIHDQLDTPLAFAKGLPNALYTFGQILRSEPRTAFGTESFLKWSLHNYAEADPQTFLQTGRRFIERTGISLRELTRAHASEEFKSVATSMLDADDFESALKEYLHADLDQESQIIALNEERGIAADAHLFLREWCCFIEDGWSDNLIWFKRLKERDALSDFAVSESKAALRKIGNTYWLLPDLRLGSKYELPGLSDDEASLIEKRFLCRSNWINPRS